MAIDNHRIYVHIFSALWNLIHCEYCEYVANLTQPRIRNARLQLILHDLYLDSAITFLTLAPDIITLLITLITIAIKPSSASLLLRREIDAAEYLITIIFFYKRRISFLVLRV